MLGSYPSTRIFLLFSHDVFTRQVGLPYLPSKPSARDNSPTRVNFSPSCVTSISCQFERHFPISEMKRYFLSAMIIFSFFVNLMCFPRLLQILERYKEYHA